MNNTELRIFECLKRIKGSTFDETDNLITDGWMDSFDLLKLINAIEEEFGIKISMENIDPNSFNSVDRIEELLQLYIR